MSYEAIARLGRGGMGVVDLARDREGNRVALKRLTFHGSANDIVRARQRLLREAEVLRRLNHPNVVRLLDVIDEGDEIVLVMPYLPGGNLAERVAQHGPAPATEVERQAWHLFGALAQAQQLGIVHRDIKPANILFDERGEPCLVDFGVARSWDQTPGLTVSGMVVGTPGFMAPEQARGETVTPASDVFSLGATLLFAATGTGPFATGDPGLLMVRAASGKVDRVPRHLPRSLRRLLRATLEPRPERRPLAAEVVDPQRVAASPAGLGARRTRAWAAGGAALITAALLGAGAATMSGDGDGGNDDAVSLEPSKGGETPDTGPGSTGPVCPGDGPDDGEPVDGCEPAADAVDSTVLESELTGTIVAPDDVDTFPIRAPQNRRDCAGTLVVRLTVPGGMDLQLAVLGDGVLLGRATGAKGSPAVVPIGAERCAPDGAPLDLQAEVSVVGDYRVTDAYLLEVDVRP